MAGPRVSTTAATVMLTGLLSRLDGFAGAATLEVGTGPQPSAGAASAQPLVCTFALAKPAGTLVGGVLTLSSAPSMVQASGGVPTWARLKDGSGAWMLDLKARRLSDPEDPNDPAQVVVQDVATPAGTLLRLLAGTVRF